MGTAGGTTTPADRRTGPVLVCFHAHPDDEAMLTAGTMAKAAARGARVVLVVATRGECGPTADEQVDADDTADDTADDLGAVRLSELERSAAALGVARVEVLGYGDSGSSPTSPSKPGGPRPFVAVPVEDAAAQLAAILQDEGADVLTTYDPLGGYGHPDHVRVHEVGFEAARLAETPVVLEATISRDLLALALTVVPQLGLELPAEFVPPDLSTVYAAGSEITHTIDVRQHLEAKRASMQAHVSQTTGGTTVRTLAVFLSLPDDLFAAAFGTEWFIDRALPPGSAETDVFTALDRAAT
jgi:LmbE family N-acetylglucosaminyl deacetylase